ncbi:MAG: hypothetical protein ACXVAM_08540 [Vulcanimicrobiaceae bacterium]
MCKREIVALCAALTFSIALSGCGAQSTNNPLPAQPDGTSAAALPGATTSNEAAGSTAPSATAANPTGTLGTTTFSTASTAPTSMVLAKGPIVYVMSGRFEIKSQTGAYMWISTNSSTKYAGVALKNGTYAVVVGTGSTALTAAFVGLYSSAPGSFTWTGRIMSTQPYGYALRLASGAYVPVAVNKTTIEYGVAVDSDVQVVGIGSSATANFASTITSQSDTTSSVATSTATTTIAQRHLLTADYLMGKWGTRKITPAQAAPYLTWAQTSASDGNAIHAAGIKTQIYVDPNHVGTNTPLYYNAVESMFAHTCSGTRILATEGGVTTYQSNPESSTLVSHWQSYVASLVAQGHVDQLWEDDGGALALAYTTYSPSLPCSYNATTWTNASIALNNAVNVPVFMNGLNNFHDGQPSPVLAVLAGSNTVGGDMEHCYSDNSQPIMGYSSWPIIENLELQVLREGKTFECMARNTNTASTQIPARIFTLASFLLTYDPSRAILAEEFQTTTQFHVMPESGLVPLNPLTAAPTDVSQLKTSTGAYGREFAHCYLRGTLVGACAVAISRDYGASHPFPFSGYRHTLVISGSGVLDGGTVSVSGPAPPSVMKPYTAVIAIK